MTTVRRLFMWPWILLLLAASPCYSLGLSFEANHGQWDSTIAFGAHAEKYGLYVTRTGLVVMGEDRDASSVRLIWGGVDPSARIQGEGELPGRSNYFVGNVPDKWLAGVPHFAQVRYKDLYRGIDLLLYGRQGNLEFDYIIAPGRDPARIRLSVQGGPPPVLDAAGDLVISAGGQRLRLKRPHAYQESDGKRVPVACRYRLRRENVVEFELSRHDRWRPLVIDPVLAAATVLGGSRDDLASAVAVDSAGYIYLAGATNSADFPVSGSLQPFRASICIPGGSIIPPIPCSDAFVTKLDPSGKSLVYSTYIGGLRQDRSHSVAVDDTGNVYVAGWTVSSDFPTRNAVQPLHGGGGDGFVAKLGPSGELLYSTYFGGSRSDAAAALAVDRAGNAYVAGDTNSADLPILNGFQRGLATAIFYRSLDGGSTWQPVRTDDLVALALTLDPSNPSVMYARSLAHELWKSEDGGASWRVLVSKQTLKDLGIPDSDWVYMGKVTLDSRQPNTLYVSLGNVGILRSTNGGADWTLLAEGLPVKGTRVIGDQFVSFVNDILIDPSSTSVLYAATDRGVYRSFDAGLRWQPAAPIPGDGTEASQAVYALAPDLRDPSRIFAAGRAGVFLTADRGANWTPMNDGLYQPPIRFVVQDPRAPSTFYAGDISLWRSHNGGTSWEKLNIPGLAERLTIDPRDSTLFVAGGSDVLRSTDGGVSWSSLGPLPPSGGYTLTVGPGAPSALYLTNPNLSGDAFLAKFDSSGSLVYSTYLGGSANESAGAIAVDDSGSVYVAGYTESSDFPTVSPFQGSPAGPDPWNFEGFVAKLGPDGSDLVYSTYLGGSGSDFIYALALDAAGSVYVGGSTASLDFPTASPAQAAAAGWSDGFLSKLNAAGDRLVYSTYLGGTGLDEVRGLAVDRTGRLTAVGWTRSPDFPTVNPLQPTLGGDADAFVAVLDPAGGWFVDSTYLGGGADDSASAVAIDSSGSVYVAGQTRSPEFSGTRFGPAGSVGSSAFVVKLLPGAAGPIIHAVLNAASYSDVSFAPGTVVAVYGQDLAGETLGASAVPLPTVLAGTSMTVNGLPAPLFFVSKSQINAQIPYEVTGTTARVQVRNGSALSLDYMMRITAASPGAFTWNQRGSGDGIVADAIDFHLITAETPARPQQHLAVYFTGLGLLEAPVPTGGVPAAPYPRTRFVPDVSIGGRAAPVTWAGAAPGLVGLYQVNVQVPPDTPVGPQILQLTLSGAAANPVAVHIRAR